MPGTNKHAVAKMAAETPPEQETETSHEAEKKPTHRYTSIDAIMRAQEQPSALLVRINHGIDTWRTMVRDCIMDLETADKVIVPNDSVIFRREALDKLFSETQTVLLHMDPTQLFERLKDRRLIDNEGRVQNVENLPFGQLYKRYMRTVARRVSHIIDITHMDDYAAKNAVAGILTSKANTKVA